MASAAFGKRPRDEGEVEEGEVAEAAVDAPRGDDAASTPAVPPPSSCTHTVAVPAGANVDPAMLVDPPSTFEGMSFPFELDAFQRIALAAVDRAESVLVAAHTSAGKTVVAQYAIATSLKRGQRVVYTSPIKALSNQKYRELAGAFDDVGLMTGDCNVNTDAAVLVMTTEILRNMLYRGHELIREVQWVVFDEVHYMRDAERGVIWEECIILLPRAVRFVFLSATIPNALEFAQWVAELHAQPCHVVTTPARPTPLEHWGFAAGGDGLRLLLGSDGHFRKENFAAAMSELKSAEGAKAAAKVGSRHSPDLQRVLALLERRDLTPTIVFAFARKECEGAAMHARKLDLLPQTARETVRSVFNAAVGTLSADDRSLPAIAKMLPMLERGVAVHHSGLLPVIKEVVEILFQEGLIKVLFATETFALGVNMPARSVVFTSMRKWDGKEFRLPSAAEYVQMSGRAGRRGIDDRGTVVLLLAEEMDQRAFLKMISGQSLPLSSAFRLRYNTLLKLYKMEVLQPEALISRSFYAFQRREQLQPSLDRQADLGTDAAALAQDDESRLLAIVASRERAASRRAEAAAHLVAPRHALRFLTPGRLVHVGSEKSAEKSAEISEERGWGAVLGWWHDRHVSLGPDGEAPADADADSFVVDVMLPCAAGAADAASRGEPVGASALNEPSAEAHVLPIRLSAISAISAVRIHLPDEVRSARARRFCLEALRQVFNERRLSSDALIREACLGASDLGVSTPECAEKLADARAADARADRIRDEIIAEMKSAAGDAGGAGAEGASASAASSVDERIGRFAEKRAIEALARAEAASAVQTDEFAKVVQLKGRAAAEVDSTDEVLVAELMLGGVFNELSPAALTALCSCLIAPDVEKVKRSAPPHEDLAAAYESLRGVASHVASVYKDADLLPTETTEEFVDRYSPGLLNVVYAWAGGAPFAELCSMVDLFEGSIIRAIRRLSELLDELKSAAKAIGNDALFKAFGDGCDLIRRDIVFSSSLYVEG